MWNSRPSAINHSLLLQTITSRREFLKLSGFGLLSLAGLSNNFRVRAITPSTDVNYGRTINSSLQLYELPSLQGKKVKVVYQDTVLRICDVTVGDTSTTYNRIWYNLNNEGYVNSRGIQPVQILPSSGDQNIPLEGCLGEVTVPFTDTHWWPDQAEGTAYRLYYATTHWITRYKIDRAEIHGTASRTIG